MVIGSSLTPHVAILVPLTGPTGTVVVLQGWQKTACESRPGHL